MRDSARELLSCYEPDSPDRALVFAAIALAERHHRGQRRASGEDFVEHPIAVAEIVARQGLSAETAAAAVCHDLIEDTSVTVEELSDTLTPSVAQIVEGVTKVSGVWADPSASASAETFKKLLIAAADDARVLVIKIADRLHNVRTIRSLAHARQLANCEETLEIYAPLARRLGMAQIARELEDRCLRVVDPSAYAEASELQRELSQRERHTLRALKSELTQALGALTDPPVSAFEIKHRVKSVYSLAQKLKRRSPDQLHDVLGVRVITEGPDWECYRILGETHSLWAPKPGHFDDYIARPKASLYQSLHTTVIASGAPVEVQIRTREMDEVAEHGIAAHWAYKEQLSEGGPQTTRRYIQRLADNQREAHALEEAFEALRADVFGEEIYVFTPAGDAKILPAGATPIDFAYSVHSEIGDRARSARVDGVFSPLDRKLRSGERVEINVGDESRRPSESWLRSAVTARARARIRARLYEMRGPGEAEAERGLARLAEGARAAGLVELAEEGNLRHALQSLGYESAEHAAAQADRDKGRARQIIEELREHERAETASQPAPRIDPPSPAPRAELTPHSEIWISGEPVRSAAWHLAGCCQPRPGDQIVAYVTAARGTAIHRADCANVGAALEAGSQRVLPAEWDASAQVISAKIQLAYTERAGLLSQLSEAIYSAGCELSELRLATSGSVVRGEIVCVAGSEEALRSAIQKLEQIPERLRVELERPL